jgi:hypothetical protein
MLTYADIPDERGAQVGMTTHPSKVFENRDATEITYCQEDDLFLRINSYRSSIFLALLVQKYKY